jgi:hypothetical protein
MRGRGCGFESHREHVARDFCAKNCTTCDLRADAGGGVLLLIKFFLLFIFGFFREFFAQAVR